MPPRPKLDFEADESLDDYADQQDDCVARGSSAAAIRVDLSTINIHGPSFERCSFLARRSREKPIR